MEGAVEVYRRRDGCSGKVCQKSREGARAERYLVTSAYIRDCGISNTLSVCSNRGTFGYLPPTCERGIGLIQETDMFTMITIMPMIQNGLA